MKKLFLTITLVIAIISLTIFSINLIDIISKRNWSKTEATVTSVHLPDGIVCGDFIDDKGVIHTDQPLYSDFNFQQIRAVKGADQDKINKMIGRKITVLYKNDQTVSYDNLRKNIIVSLSVFLSALASSIYMIKRNRN